MQHQTESITEHLIGMVRKSQTALYYFLQNRVYLKYTISEASIFVKIELYSILFYNMQLKSLNLFLHFTIDIWAHMSYYINIQLYNYIILERR